MKHVAVAVNVQQTVANKTEATKTQRYLNLLGGSLNKTPKVQTIKQILISCLMKIEGRGGSERSVDGSTVFLIPL